MTSLKESIQKNLGYHSIFKMDPNTQDVQADGNNAGIRSLPQAAIPSMACALLNRLQSPEGAEKILRTENTNWPGLVFGNNLKELIQRMAKYAGASIESTRQEFIHIANETVRLIREAVADAKDQEAIHAHAAGQKNESLLYLPGALDLGSMINNNPLDDLTHKMQGPISNLMHSIENRFN